jgi:DNA-binding NarL/FixJ family response regulator
MSAQPIPVRSVKVELTLKPRQVQILRLIAEGKCNKEIAVEMKLSESRLKQLVSGILYVLGVDNRISAAIWAIRKGLC